MTMTSDIRCIDDGLVDTSENVIANVFQNKTHQLHYRKKPEK